LQRLVSSRAGLKAVEAAIPTPVWQRLLVVLYCQVHWAFYRSGPILIMGDLYWGAFVGLVLALLEMGLNPAWWGNLRNSETAAPVLVELGAVWISTLLFVATQNLWLTVAAHLAVMGLLGRKRQDASRL